NAPKKNGLCPAHFYPLSHAIIRESGGDLKRFEGWIPGLPRSVRACCGVETGAVPTRHEVLSGFAAFASAGRERLGRSAAPPASSSLQSQLPRSTHLRSLMVTRTRPRRSNPE